MNLPRTIFISSILCLSVACEGGPKDTKATDTPEKTAAATDKKPEAAKMAAAQSDEAKKAAEEAKKKQDEAKRVAEAMAKVKADAEKAKQRWTDDLRKKAKDLVETDYKDAKAALTAILASEHRTPGNSDRDKYRRPLETLTFFGIKPDMTVIEVGAGRGWYTEILAPLLAKNGKLIAGSYDPNGPKDSFRTMYGMRVKYFLEQSSEVFGKVQMQVVNPPDKLDLGPENSVDMVLAMREMHNWYRRDFLKPYAQSVFKTLKPGGVLGVVQHRAKEGADPKTSAGKGYLPEAWLIKEIESVGFKLADKSDVNSNPKDTKDYEKGVWTLPPNFAEKDKDKAKYAAIGESDRMTLKFVKPAK